jgi:hypothetical protein
LIEICRLQFPGGFPEHFYGRINPNGVLVGPGANINCNSFTASTLDIPDNIFMQGGTLTFSGDSSAKITNLGKIEALGGDVVLIGFG